MALDRNRVANRPAATMNRSFFATTDERTMGADLQRRQRGDSAKIDTLDLAALMRMKPLAVKKYWDIILPCVDWIYTNAAEKGTTAVLAKAASLGHGKSREARDAWSMASSAIKTLATEYMNRNPGTVGGVDPSIMFELCVNEIIGLGIIEPIWNDPRVEEVWIDGPDRIRVAIKGQKKIVQGACFKDADHVMRFCETILKQANRNDLHIDTRNPYVDARLRDLSRVAIASTDICPGGPIVSIRRHPTDYFSITQMVEWGTCTKEMWLDLARWMRAKMSVLVIGETGSGKTSFLDALSGLFPTNARIMTIEDVLELELNPNKPFKVPGCEKREPNKEGEGGFSIRDHVKMSLRMAPDIVVIGEVRDKAAYDLVDAANTGHQVFSTIHANGADDAIVRLMNLISMSGEISGPNALPMIASAFDLIVYIDRLSDGSRHVMSISEVDSFARIDESTGEKTVKTFPLWEFQQTGTTPEGKILGEYKRVGELSELTRKRHRLDFVPQYTWEECLKTEGFEGNSTKIDR